MLAMAQQRGCSSHFHANFIGTSCCCHRRKATITTICAKKLSRPLTVPAYPLTDELAQLTQISYASDELSQLPGPVTCR
jgi:hypothetical protein